MKTSTISILTSTIILIFVFTLACYNSKAQAPVSSKFIIVDQFGYLPNSKKTAVIRDPQIGYDSQESFQPGAKYAVVNRVTGEQVLTGAPVKWQNGATDSSSGDKVWWFDFSAVTNVGKYFILDVDSNFRSYEFEIREDIYKDALVQAVRTFFYQRSGFAKETPFAGTEWADAASHLQDKTARDFLKKSDASTEINVSGGWYDAGDYNKYTNWTANYVTDFMKAFLENPGVWGDDYNIPESGNSIPDILDEAKWGIDHLLRLQRPDGSMLSVVGVSHASPPSAAKGATYYGTPNTSGTLNSAAAFAIASKVYRSAGMKTYADSLKNSALKAWNWAIANTNVIYNNNTGITSGLAAGNQETDDYGRFIAKMEAAAFLYEITSEQQYKTFFESNYNNVHMMQWTFAYPFETANQEILLYYTTLPGISATVKNNILNKYRSAMDGAGNFAAIASKKDPYQAHLEDYTWGSNSVKSSQGLMYTGYIYYNVNAAKNAQALEAAEGYIHYLHGVNPLNIVYLSNMYKFGAENSVNEFYHSWFTNGSEKWDRVGTSQYGPAPGFLTGGPNPGYDWDGCCSGGCGSSNNNALCLSESISPPKGQPNQKSYKDFNTSWPLNSWEVTENSCGYQINYIRLLAAFLPSKYDCSGALNGSASYDVCGVCSGSKPIVTAFTIPTTSASLVVPVSSFTASDNKAVTGFKLTETSAAPLAGDAGWTTVAPTSYTFATEGTKTLYAWAKDEAGNVSESVSTQVVIPTKIGYTETFSSASSSTVRRAIPVTFNETGQIQSISVYHNAGSGNVILGVYSDVAGFPSALLSVTPSTAVRATAGWQTVTLTTPVNVVSGQKVWLAWVFQNVSNIRYERSITPASVSTGGSGWSSGMPSAFGKSYNGNFKFSVYCTYTTSAVSDVTKPIVTAFTIPATSASLVVPVSSFTASDNRTVTGFKLTETSAAPLAGDAGWTTVAPTSYTFATEGTKTLYAWAKDKAGNVSESVSAQVVIPTEIGNKEVFGLASSSTVRRAMPVTFTEAGKIQSISVYHNAGSGNVMLGVYSDVAGFPSALLGVTPSTAVTTTAGWQTVTLTTPVTVTSGQKVWLAWVFQNVSNIRYERSSTPASVSTGGSGWSSGMPSAFGKSYNGNFKFSVYCTYIADDTKSAVIAGEIEPVFEKADLKVYPNPFSEKLRFEFVSPESVSARIDLYDMTGRIVKTIFEQPIEGGVNYEADFRPETIISGMYIYRMTMGDAVYNGKVVFKKE